MTCANKIDSALILAAGFGSRLAPITDKTPKCLVKVKERSMLAHTIERVKKVADTVYVNTHYLSDLVHKFISTQNEQIKIIHEPTLLGNGGTIKKIANEYNDNIIIVHNSDAFFEGADFIEDFIINYNGQEMFLALYPKSRLKHPGRGDFEIVEGKAKMYKGGAYTYTGLAILKTKAFAECKDNVFSMVDIIKQCKDIGHYLIPENVSWIDIGTHENLSLLSYLMAER